MPIDYKNKREHDNLKYYKESVKLNMIKLQVFAIE